MTLKQKWLEVIYFITMVIGAWVILCVLCSVVRTMDGSLVRREGERAPQCDSHYPIDNFVYSKLFCAEE